MYFNFFHLDWEVNLENDVLFSQQHRCTQKKVIRDFKPLTIPITSSDVDLQETNVGAGQLN